MMLAHKTVTALSGFLCTCKQQKDKLPAQFSKQGLITFYGNVSPLCHFMGKLAPCASVCFCVNYESHWRFVCTAQSLGLPAWRESLAGWIPAPRHTSMDLLLGFTTPHIKGSSSDHTDCCCWGRVPEHMESLLLPCLWVCFHHRNFSSSQSREQTCRRWSCLMCPAVPVKQGLGTSQQANLHSLPLSQHHTHITAVVCNT